RKAGGREARRDAEDAPLLRCLVPLALATRARGTPPLRRLGPACPSPPLRRAELPEARPRELPRHGRLPGQDGAQAGLPLPLRGYRHGALRDGRDDLTRPPDGRWRRSGGSEGRRAGGPLLPYVTAEGATALPPAVEERGHAAERGRGASAARRSRLARAGHPRHGAHARVIQDAVARGRAGEGAERSRSLLTESSLSSYKRCHMQIGLFAPVVYP